CQDESSLWLEDFYSIHSCRFLSLVILAYPSYRNEPGCSGFAEELLQLLYFPVSVLLAGFVNSLVNAVDVLFQLAPGKLVPTLTHLLRCFFLFRWCLDALRLTRRTYLIFWRRPCCTTGSSQSMMAGMTSLFHTRKAPSPALGSSTKRIPTSLRLPSTLSMARPRLLKRTRLALPTQNRFTA